MWSGDLKASLRIAAEKSIHKMSSTDDSSFILFSCRLYKKVKQICKDQNQIIHECVLWFIYSSITCRILVKVLELTIDIKCTGRILSRQKKVDGNCSNFKSKNWEDYTYVYVIARGLFAYN